VAVALLITFSIAGFLGAYLYTRLHLQNAFELALRIKNALTKRVDADAKATAMVQQQLTPGADRIAVDALTKALEEATSGIRTQAFFLARKQRFEDWREGTPEEKKEFAGLGLPIFEALIALDPQGHYYRSRAELGYALLLQDPPRFADARAAFSEAIELRPAKQAGSTQMYEFSRAFCNVELDPDWPGPKFSSEAVVEVVCADIAVALDALDQVDEDRRKVVRKWLKHNSRGSSSMREQMRVLLKKFPKRR